MGMSPVGTSRRASNEKALEPDTSACADGYARPQFLDDRPISFVVATGSLGCGGEEGRVERAAESLGRGARLVERCAQHSIRRRNDRSVHSGDLACSVSLSWLMMPRTVSAAAEPASGMPVGSLSRSLI